MALDGIILSKINRKLQDYLPMRINRIIDVAADELIFNVRTHRQKINLLISCHTLYNRICLTQRAYNTYDNPSAFVMLLRKHIHDGIIYRIEQYDLDRLLILSIKAQDDLYDRKEYRLYVELMGKYANVILVDQSTGKIIDAIKRIPPYENTKRIIQPGAIYTLPAKQNKKDPFQTSQVNQEESFVQQFAGFSKLLEKEVRYRMAKESFAEIMAKITSSDKLYLTYENDQIAFHVIPLTHLGSQVEERDIFEGFDLIYHNLEEKERIKKVGNNLAKFIERQLKHCQSKLEKLRTTYEESLNHETYKEIGDLLYTYGNLEQKGQNSIALSDYAGQIKTIELDPKKSIKDNANRYYQTYRKKKKSQSFLLEQIATTENEAEYFRSLSEQIAIANVEDAINIQEELSNYGYLKARKRHYAKQQSKVRIYQVKYRDHTISFGKNNVQNNYLTFKYAKKDDYWFHAQGYHGCHLTVDSNDPDEGLIRFCANLAAYYSKGRYSGSVGVDYCQVKDVKKIPGARVGFVSIRNQKTIYIDPEYDPHLKITTV